MEFQAGIHHKRGYLHKDFALFHIKDRKQIEFDFHYHDFNKIIIFLSGKVVYHIEGKAYTLKPWDILLVNHHEIHKPMIDTSEEYERVAIWINWDFVNKHNGADANLLHCFQKAASQKFNLLRLSPEGVSTIRQILFSLEEACKDQEFGSQVLQNSLFLQLLVLLNRAFLGIETPGLHQDIECDAAIEDILEYINGNLGEELSVDQLASLFYTSKYYLMRKFKKQTGYTLHNYIQQKRLIAANGLIKEGKPLSFVCAECGFGDYSNFVRAFKKMFGLSPKQHYKLLVQQQKDEASSQSHL